MALASYSSYYKAPREIIRMRNDLAALPCWYANIGGFVLVPTDADVDAFQKQCLGKGIVPSGTCLTESQLMETVLKKRLPLPIRCSPWGWDPALVQSLSVINNQDSFRFSRKIGIPSSKESNSDSSSVSGENILPAAPFSLPTIEQLNRIRILSGRQQCVKVLEDFQDFSGICGEAVVCQQFDDVLLFMQNHQDVILKAPWSGSGRGLIRTSLTTWTMNQEGWVRRILRTQGLIMAEPIYNKVEDFAMEFYMDHNHQLSFVGYSLFETDSHGNYKGNLLSSNERIVERLTQYVPADLLISIRQRLLLSLRKLLGSDYVGYFGVDMMICQEQTLVDESSKFSESNDGNGCEHPSRTHLERRVGIQLERTSNQTQNYVVHPCVEINLRMNMGVIARLLSDRYISELSEGKYMVEHFSTDGEAFSFDSQMQSANPLQIKNHKVVNGYFSLTPITETTRYQCYVIVAPIL